jgi:Ca2+-binding RTX toxin-like protein
MNNTFYSGIGDDTFTGGDGDDTFVASATVADGNDSFIGGAGNDTIDYSLHFSGTTVGVCIYLDGTVAAKGVTATPGTSGSCTVGTPASGAVNVTTPPATGDLDKIYADVENAIGTPNADSITGNASVNSLYGFGGKDWIFGLAANDQIDLNAYRAKTAGGYWCSGSGGCVTAYGGATVVTVTGSMAACDCTGKTGNALCNQFTGARIGSLTTGNVDCSASNMAPVCDKANVSANCGSDALDLVSCAGATSGNDAATNPWATYPTCWKVQL